MNEATQKFAESWAVSLMNNKAIREFVRTEALNKVAAEMQKEGFSCTGKAVNLMTIRYPNIAKRVNEYIALGLIGVMQVGLGHA